MSDTYEPVNWFNIEKEVFMKDVIARLKEHQSPTPSKWRERAEWRMQNKSGVTRGQARCDLSCSSFVILVDFYCFICLFR